MCATQSGTLLNADSRVGSGARWLQVSVHATRGAPDEREMGWTFLPFRRPVGCGWLWLRRRRREGAWPARVSCGRASSFNPCASVSRQIQMRMSEDPITPARGPREMQVPSAAVTPLESPEVWPSPSCRGFATSNLLRAVAGVSSRCGARCALCAPTSTCPRSVRRPTRQASSSSDRAAARQTFLGCSCPV